MQARDDIESKLKDIMEEDIEEQTILAAIPVVKEQVDGTRYMVGTLLEERLGELMRSISTYLKIKKSHTRMLKQIVKEIFVDCEGGLAWSVVRYLGRPMRKNLMSVENTAIASLR